MAQQSQGRYAAEGRHPGASVQPFMERLVVTEKPLIESIGLMDVSDEGGARPKDRREKPP